jgi:chaperonin GroEL
MKPLEMALDSGRPILVVGNDISGDALQGLVLNKVKGSLRVCAVKSPGFGVTRHDMLLDLQSVVGGTIMTDSFDVSNFKIEDFGSCEQLIVHKNMTMIITNSSHNNQESIAERIESIKKRMELKHSLEQEEISVLKYRLQQLSGGIAILRVGAATESELIERYDRLMMLLMQREQQFKKGYYRVVGYLLQDALILFMKKLKRLKI